MKHYLVGEVEGGGIRGGKGVFFSDFPSGNEIKPLRCKHKIKPSTLSKMSTGLTASFGPGESPTTAVSSALSSMEMEDAQPSEEVAAPKDTKSTMNLHMLHQLKQEVPALYAPSRLGRALSELFGLLVKLCVGSSMRHRIRPNPQANQTVPSEAARKTARTLMELLMSSLQWRPPTADALPKFR